MNPELIKSVIAGNSNSVPSIPTVNRLNPVAESRSKETPPLTIFFNGTISVFNVPRDKAETIMRAAMKGSSKSSDETVSMEVGGGGGLSFGDHHYHHHQLVGPLSGG